MSLNVWFCSWTIFKGGGTEDKESFLPRLPQQHRFVLFGIVLLERQTTVHFFRLHDPVMSCDSLDIGDLAQTRLRVVPPETFAYRISWFVAVPGGAPDLSGSAEA